MRRVGHEVESGDEHDGNNEAEVLERHEADVRSDAVHVEDASDDADLHEAAQSTATVVGRDLTDVHGLSGHDEPNAEALQQSRDVDLGHIAGQDEKDPRENEED